MILLTAVVSASVHAGIPSPRADTPPPGADADTPLPHPPGADTPSDAEHARRYGQRAGGTHPTGMQSCLVIFSENRMKIQKTGPGVSKILLCRSATIISFVVTTTRSRKNLVRWLSDSFFNTLACLHYVLSHCYHFRLC